MMKLIYCVCLFVIATTSVIAQTSAVDLKNTFPTPTDSSKIHSPKKAMIYSAIIPGAGQIYNHIAMPKGKKKAFWKVPLILGGLGVTSYYAIQNNIKRNAAGTEYRFREKNPGLFQNPDFITQDNLGLLTIYNSSQTTRDLFIFGAIAVYALNILDAGVEAHFTKFDVTDNLSLNIAPTLMQNTTVGMHLSLNFR